MLFDILFTILYYFSFIVCLLFFYFLLRQRNLSGTAKQLIKLIGWAVSWTGLAILAPSNIFSENIHVFLWRIVFVSSSFVTISLFRFVLSYNKVFSGLNKAIYYFLLWVVIIPTSIIWLFTDLLITGRVPGKMMWEIGYAEGALYPLSASIISLGVMLSFAYSFYFLIKAKDRLIKKQLRLILIGICFPLFVGVTTNLIMPILKISFPRFASVSAVALISFLYYVIYEYGGLDIKARRYSIRFRLIIYFLVINFITLSIGFVVFYFISSSSLTGQIEAHVTESANEKAMLINNFLIRQSQKIVLLGQHGSSYSNMLKTEKGGSNYDSIYINVEDRLTKSLDVDFKEICLLDINGQAVVSTNKINLGHDFSPYLNFSSDAAYFSKTILDIYNEPILYASYPIFNFDNIKIGYILAHIDMNTLYENLIEFSAKKDGEAYIINKDGYLVTPLNNRKELILREKISNKAAEDCLSLLNGSSIDKIKVSNVYSFENSQATGVAAVFATIPMKQWCLIYEANEQEFIIKPLRKIANSFYYILSLATLLTILLAYFISRTFSKPIALLQQGAKEITNGNLDYITEVGVRDEFAELAEAFNLMSAELKKSYSILEKKVRERTEELQVALSSISDSRKAVLNILEDVEEEKEKVGKEKDKINAILHSIGDAVLVIDDEYRVIMINKIVEEVSGFSASEMVGKKYFDVLKFVTEKEGREVKSFVEIAMKKGEIRKMDRHTLLIKKNGAKVPVADSSSPLRDKNGKIIGCVVVFRDVTFESQIDQAKTEFVSLASHQLRTPLSTIGWYAEMMLAGDAGKINEEQRQYLDEIYKGNKRMVDLVNALLNVSRLELGTFSIEPENIYLKDIAESVLNELKPQIETKGMAVSKFYDENLTKNYSADPKLTRIIFQNLLSNAVKYTPDRGEIDLSIKIVKSEILITVSDTGLGIPDNQKGLIFSKLFRADNVKETDTEGTGLGLYIIKSIVENIGGKIWFESPSLIVKDAKTKNRGTSFYLSLPLEGMKKKAGAKTLS